MAKKQTKSRKKIEERPKPIQTRMVRNKRITISLNEKEYRVIERFCTTYKIQNRTKFYRETIIRNILQKFEEDAPTLF